MIAREHWKQARQLLEAALAENPGDAESLYLLAQVRLAFGQDGEALALAERAASLEPKNGFYRHEIAEVYGQMAVKASWFRKPGLGKRFKHELDSSLALDPDIPDALEALMTYDLEAPGFWGGDVAKAHAIAEKLARIDPVRGLRAQMIVAQHEKREAEVEGFYLRRIEIAPDDYAARVELADLYVSKGRLKSAEERAREAAALAPDRAAAYKILSRILAGGRRPDELDALLTLSEHEAGEDLSPYYEAAVVLLPRDLPRAERYLRKYLSQEPEAGEPSLAEGHWRLGQVFAREGSKPSAISEFTAALRLKPDLSEARSDLERVTGS